MNRKLLAATAAALALGSVGAARANDVAPVWNYVEAIQWLYTGPYCDLFICGLSRQDFTGVFGLDALPDNTVSKTIMSYDSPLGTDTVSFKTSGGELVYYNQVRDFRDSSEQSLYSLSLTAEGGWSHFDGRSGPQQMAYTIDYLFYLDGTPTPVIPNLVVPEPLNAVLMIAGLGLLSAMRRRVERG
jgi:hypothetical protein